MNTTAISLSIAAVLLAAPMLASATPEASPYLAPDDSWLTLSGKVTSTTDEAFTLDYGNGLATVEMDDWDWYPENAEILQGDNVTVYGKVDDDTFETAKIEASSVYVDSIGTYFYASSGDEEDIANLDLSPTISAGELVLTGTVTSVSGMEFTIDSGIQAVTVDTSQLPYNPMDKEGFQKIDKGDRVTVSGDMEDDTFETRELMADSVVTLYDDINS